MTFRVGKEREPFGSDLGRLVGPKYACGWLPIVQMHFRDGDAIYSEESFADVDPALAEKGVAHVRLFAGAGDQRKN